MLSIELQKERARESENMPYYSSSDHIVIYYHHSASPVMHLMHVALRP